MKQWDVHDNYRQGAYVLIDTALGCSHGEETDFKQRVSFRVKLELRENYSFDSRYNNLARGVTCVEKVTCYRKRFYW